MKKIIKYLSVLLLIAFITGCGVKEIQEKIEKSNTKEYSLKGLNITMADDLVEKKAVGYTSYLQGEKYSFASVKETFEDYSAFDYGISEESTLKEYMTFIKQANEIDSDIIEDNGLIYTKYTKNIADEDYFYMVFTYKSDDAFWIVNLFCFESDKAKYEPIFIEWAKSVNFE